MQSKEKQSKAKATTDITSLSFELSWGDQVNKFGLHHHAKWMNGWMNNDKKNTLSLYSHPITNHHNPFINHGG
jgi:hypothetical protein